MGYIGDYRLLIESIYYWLELDDKAKVSECKELLKNKYESGNSKFKKDHKEEYLKVINL